MPIVSTMLPFKMPLLTRLLEAFTSEITYWGATPLARLLERICVHGGLCVSSTLKVSEVEASLCQEGEKSKPTDLPQVNEAEGEGGRLGGFRSGEEGCSVSNENYFSSYSYLKLCCGRRSLCYFLLAPLGPHGSFSPTGLLGFLVADVKSNKVLFVNE